MVITHHLKGNFEQNERYKAGNFDGVLRLQCVICLMPRVARHLPFREVKVCIFHGLCYCSIESLFHCLRIFANAIFCCHEVCTVFVDYFIERSIFRSSRNVV